MEMGTGVNIQQLPPTRHYRPAVEPQQSPSTGPAAPDTAAAVAAKAVPPTSIVGLPLPPPPMAPPPPTGRDGVFHALKQTLKRNDGEARSACRTRLLAVVRQKAKETKGEGAKGEKGKGEGQ